jgi:hypothetical protein
MSMEEFKNKVDLMRQKAIRGEMTLEEVKESVAFLREHRRKSAVRVPSSSPAGKSAKPKAPLMNTDDLLKGLL